MDLNWVTHRAPLPLSKFRHVLEAFDSLCPTQLSVLEEVLLDDCTAKMTNKG
jgi:hypothetical protein